MTDSTKAHHGKDQGALRDTASRVYDRAAHTAENLGTSPLGILVGGLAVGAIAGALLPRSERLATQAARQAGMSELEARGLTKDAARDQAKSLLDGMTKALGTAGSAAAKAATGKADTPTP